MTFWCGFMPMTNGSGSCYFHQWPSRCQQKTNFFEKSFSAYYLLKVSLHHFSKIKSQRESHNSRNQGFPYYFCIMVEGSGSIPLTNGSGSRRPKNMRIRRIQIQIRSTACKITWSVRLAGSRISETPRQCRVPRPLLCPSPDPKRKSHHVILCK